jgi:multiple sugar transport system permease protein
MVFMAWTLGPFAWTIVASVSQTVELLSKPPHWIPHHPTFDNYASLLMVKAQDAISTAVQAGLLTNLWYSALVSVLTTVLCLVVGSLAAYAFSRLPFRTSASWFYIIFGSQLLPFIVTVIPLYISLVRLHLLDRLGTLIFLYVSFTLPFVIWLMRNYFEMIPNDLEEAAQIDGCTPIGALFRVVLPVCAPGLTATGIFAFLSAWNEFFIALIFMSRTKTITLSIATLVFGFQHRSELGIITTGAVIASLPPVILALVFQKFIVRGLMSGATKG